MRTTGWKGLGWSGKALRGPSEISLEATGAGTLARGHQLTEPLSTA